MGLFTTENGQSRLKIKVTNEFETYVLLSTYIYNHIYIHVYIYISISCHQFVFGGLRVHGLLKFPLVKRCHVAPIAEFWLFQGGLWGWPCQTSRILFRGGSSRGQRHFPTAVGALVPWWQTCKKTSLLRDMSEELVRTWNIRAFQRLSETQKTIKQTQKTHKFISIHGLAASFSIF